MSNATLYTTPGCPQCMVTEIALEKNGVQYDVVDLSTNPEALERVKAMGYMQAPVIETDDDHWSGFQPDKIAALAKAGV
jgi:glutaredoxin-like protein NrdH